VIPQPNAVQVRPAPPARLLLQSREPGATTLLRPCFLAGIVDIGKRGLSSARWGVDSDAIGWVTGFLRILAVVTQMSHFPSKERSKV
jgi:hypothetical protein